MEIDSSAPVADLGNITAIAPRLRVLHISDPTSAPSLPREILALSAGRDLTEALGRLEDCRFVVATASARDGVLRRIKHNRVAAVVVDLRAIETRAALESTIAEVALRHETTAIIAVVAHGRMATQFADHLHVCDEVISDVDLSEERFLFALVRALERRSLSAQLAVARRELLLSEASLLLTLLTATTPSVVLDDDGKVVFANREAERLVAESRAAMYGRRPPAPFAGGIGTFTLPDGSVGTRRLHDILWERKSATLVVLVRDAHDLERWREVQAHTAVGVAHLDHADDAIGKLRQLVQRPNVAGDIVADVVAGLAKDLNGARGTLAQIARRSRADERQR